MLSATELATLQTIASGALDQTCVIQRKTRTSDGMGSSSETYATITTVAAGMSQPTAGQLQNYAFMIGSLAAWQIKLPVGTSVQHQDHLVIAGQTLEVQVVLSPRSYQTLLTVLASEIK